MVDKSESKIAIIVVVVGVASSFLMTFRRKFMVEKNPGFIKKAQPIGFLVFYWVLSFIGFLNFFI